MKIDKEIYSDGGALSSCPCFCLGLHLCTECLRKARSSGGKFFWYLKRNISCYANLLNDLLETDAEDDCLEMMSSWCRQVN
jgi:hypothetical protein